MSLYQKSFRSEFKKSQNRSSLFFLLTLILIIYPYRFLLAATFLFGFFEVIKDGAFRDAKHVPNTVQISLIFVFHTLEPFIYRGYPLLNRFHLQLHESRNTFIQRCIIDLFLDPVTFLTHQFVNLRK